MDRDRTTIRRPRRRALIALAGAALALLLPARQAEAHDLRPAYLEIRETSPGRYAILWRTPRIGGSPLGVTPKMPDDAIDITSPAPDSVTDADQLRWTVMVDDGSLGGRRIEFPGLERTTTDVLVRVEWLVGAHATSLVHPSQPYLVIAPSGDLRETAVTYITLGVLHILNGIDHLLFVLGLLLLARGPVALLKTVTAFTVAHSITLALATLGLVHVPPAPVEAAIALSIVVLAVEITRQRRGWTGPAQRHPWLLAFAFGLLHGLGFAGALTRAGIPAREIPVALVSFNVGVEAGQLTFVAACVAVVFIARRLRVPRPQWAQPIPGYAIGVIAMVWFVQRVAVML